MNKPGDLYNKMMKKKALKLAPASKGRKPKGAQGRAAVKALGRTRTTGNFAKIEASKGKGAAIAAYQNALKAHKGKRRKTKKKLSLQGVENGVKRIGRLGVSAAKSVFTDKYGASLKAQGYGTKIGIPAGFEKKKAVKKKKHAKSKN